MKMPWGKYKGEELDDIPTDYLEWCLREATVSAPLGEEMEAQIQMRGGQGVIRQKGRLG